MKDFLESRSKPEDWVVALLADWLAWVTFISAASAALAAVCLEHLISKLMQRPGQVQPRPSPEEERDVSDPFLQGARLMVRQAFAGHSTSFLRLWRWLESLIAVFWLGFALLLVRWVLWLPVVFLLYAVPAVRVHGVREVLKCPVLIVLTKQTTGTKGLLPQATGF